MGNRYDYSQEDFERCYSQIYNDVKKDGVLQKNHCVIFIGGQPGSGKSQFYLQDDSLRHYIAIDGDRYRKYHPKYIEICQNDIENLADKTQLFVNKCVERLIRELSDESYNLIIEGTLRNAETTINTCEYLTDKGYHSDLYVMATNAIESWQSTINRAKMLEEMGEMPRTVSLDKYNYIVNNLVGSIKQIEAAECFDKIRVINRNNLILFPNSKDVSASETVKQVLEIEKWNEEYKKISVSPKDKQIPDDMIVRRRRGR